MNNQNQNKENKQENCGGRNQTQDQQSNQQSR